MHVFDLPAIRDSAAAVPESLAWYSKRETCPPSQPALSASRGLMTVSWRTSAPEGGQLLLESEV
jgi:hypothetical protein